VDVLRREAANEHTADAGVQTTAVTVAAGVLTAQAPLRHRQVMQVREQHVQVGQRLRQLRGGQVRRAGGHSLRVVVEGGVEEVVQVRTRRRN
jgi:hypothetical protein